MALILLVDDSLFQRRIIKGLLNKMDAVDNIIEAGNGLEGLKVLETEQPDCIFSDLTMPEMDGIQFLEELKNRGCQIPVIVLTADIQKSTHQRCVDLGAFAFMNKPFDEDGISEILGKVLGTATGAN